MYLGKNNQLTQNRCIGCNKNRYISSSNLCYECVSCFGKDSFSSVISAQASVDWRGSPQSSFQSTTDLQYLTPYKCDFCSYFHLGHGDRDSLRIQKGEIYG